MASKSQPHLIVYRVFRGFPSDGQFTWSPFVTKMEARLRFAGIKYSAEVGSLSNAPKGKIPYMTLSQRDDQGNETVTLTLADSTLMIKHFVEEGLLEDLNARLSPSEKVFDLALRAMFEDKLNFYNGYERWHENYYTMRAKALWSMPYPMQIIIGYLAHRGMMTTLHGQGTGRFTSEEIHAFMRDIWANVNALAVEARKTNPSGKEPFWIFGGGAPTEADATAFGYVTSALICTAAPETGAVVKGYPALVDYATRIREKYFPDYDWIQ